MDSIPKAGIVLAILIVIFNSHVASAQSTSSQSELQAELMVAPIGTSIPMFEVELTNTGKRDLILNLGLMYREKQFPFAIHLSLRDDQNKTEILDLKGPPYVLGRVDPMVVPLPQGASIRLPINVADYKIPEQNIFDIQLKPGRYFLSAEYRGEPAKYMGPPYRDCSNGIFLVMRYWLGLVNSNAVSFVVPEK
jgi:hypothetical protein